METRTIKELLQLTLDNFRISRKVSRMKNSLFCTIYGICDCVGIYIKPLGITVDELQILDEYLTENLPKKKYGRYKSYCWPINDVKSREKWLQEQIDKLN